ncbi:PspC domain-containing protein [Aerococcus sp. 1KP-2016]|uniref:PspC domain-containing protein n=1 Tax=Aerococcus sp. 1KP-2016 TaxID=1981982 RepID=UPI000B990AAD|nr:PspC domain-containing protein [Aerococcus sp. 1KP-2016]OYQ67503.1 PspC domain-containing protein [Aerococcus sp. 1KP-2016]
MTGKLKKSVNDKWLFGVCGGIGEYFNVSGNLVRIIAVLISLTQFPVFILYIILAFLMPSK